MAATDLGDAGAADEPGPQRPYTPEEWRDIVDAWIAAKT